MASQFSFLSTCQKVAQDELAAERAERQHNSQSIEGPAQPQRKREKLFSMLGGLLPNISASQIENRDKQKTEPVFNELRGSQEQTPYPRDLQQLLLRFEWSCSVLWELMADVNTDLLLQQAAICGKESGAGLARSLRMLGKPVQMQADGYEKDETSESGGRRAVFASAAVALSMIAASEKEERDALADLHRTLGKTFQATAVLRQKDVVAMEKARARYDSARAMLRRHAEEEMSGALDAYNGLAAIVKELLDASCATIDSDIASAIAVYLRAKAKHLQGSTSVLEAVQLTSLRSGSARRHLESRVLGVPFKDPLGELISSPGLTISRAFLCHAAALSDFDSASQPPISSLVRLLDEAGVCLPLYRALLAENGRRQQWSAFHVLARTCLSEATCRGFFKARLSGILEDICEDFLAQGDFSMAGAENSPMCRNSAIAIMRIALHAPQEYPDFFRSLFNVRVASRPDKERTHARLLFVKLWIGPALRDPKSYGLKSETVSAAQRSLYKVAQLVEILADAAVESNGVHPRSESQALLSTISPLLNAFLDSLVENAPTIATLLDSKRDAHKVARDLDIVREFAQSSESQISSILQKWAAGDDDVRLMNALQFSVDTPNGAEKRFSASEEKSSAAGIKPTSEGTFFGQGRICTVPGFRHIKGKGRILGIRYRQARTEEEEDEQQDSDDQYEGVENEILFAKDEERNTRSLDSPTEHRTSDISVGIGLELEADPSGYLKVARLVPGGPAERCGLVSAGDWVVEMDARNIYTFEDPLATINQMLHGKAGSVVELGLQNPGCGVVRRVKIRRNAQYFTIDRPEPNGKEITSRNMPKVRLRNAAVSKGQSEHVGSPSARSRIGKGGADEIASTGSIGEERFELGGVGVTWCLGADSLPIVVSVAQGSPAERNGCISLGDRLCQVNDNRPQTGAVGIGICRGWAEALNGIMGTWVTLTLLSAEGGKSDADESSGPDKRVPLRRTWLPDVVWDEEGACWPPKASQSASKAAPCGVGITFKTDSLQNYVVKRIVDGGPAYVAGGVLAGDIVREIDSSPIDSTTSPESFASMILGPAGSSVVLLLERGSRGQRVPVTLQRAPAVTSAVVSESSTDSIGENTEENSISAPNNSQQPSTAGGKHIPPANISKGSDAVGIGIKCDLQPDGQFVVSKLQPGGAADRSGVIRAGDILEAVDGVELHGRSQEELKALMLGEAGSRLLVRVKRGRDSSVFSLYRGNVAPVSEPVYRESIGVAAETSFDASVYGGDPSNGDAGRCGLGMTFRISARRGMVSVRRLKEGGPAEAAGIHPNDTILSIDGVQLRNIAPRDLAKLMLGPTGSSVHICLQRADRDDVEELVLVRGPSADGHKRLAVDSNAGESVESARDRRLLSSQSSFSGSEFSGADSDSEGIRSDAESPHQPAQSGLGITFLKPDGKSGIIVKRIKAGGAAEKNGIIRPGDRIMSIDGIAIVDPTSSGLQRLIMGVPQSIARLVVRRQGASEKGGIEDAELAVNLVREASVPSSATTVSAEPSLDLDDRRGRGGKGGGRCGVGMTFLRPLVEGERKGVVVKRLKAGEAAEAAGGLIGPGDRVRSVNGVVVDGLTDSQLADLVVGPSGSLAEFTITRQDGRKTTVALVRGATSGLSREASVESVASIDSPDSALKGRQGVDTAEGASGASGSGRALFGLGLTFFRPEDDDGGRGGVVIKRVKEGGAASRLGRVRAGDRVLAIDGEPIPPGVSNDGLARLVMGPAGSLARILLSREGESPFEVEVRRDESRPANEGAIGGGVHAEPSINFDTLSTSGRVRSAGIGLTFRRRTSGAGGNDALNGYEISRVKAGGAAEASGKVQSGDEVISVDGRPVTGLDVRALALLVQGEAGTVCRMGLRRTGSSQAFIVDIVRKSMADGSTEANQHLGGDTQGTSSVSTLSVSGQKSRSKSKAGLGLVFKASDGGEGLEVKRVADGSGAQIGGIQAGDRVIAIDSKPAAGLHTKDLSALVRGPVDSEAECLVRRKDGSYHTFRLTRKPPPSDSRDGNSADGEESCVGSESSFAGSEASWASSAASDQGGLVGLGMTFLSSDGKGGRVVKRVKAGSAADACDGAVRPGDRCLSIDGVSIENAGNQTLSKLCLGPVGSQTVVRIRRKGVEGRWQETDVVLVRRDHPSSEVADTGLRSEASFDSSAGGQAGFGGRFDGQRGLGITFGSWDGQEEGLRVRRVKADGAAAASGRIKPGDRIFSIDGQPVQGLSNKQIIALVMGQPGSTALVHVISSNADDGTPLQVLLTRPTIYRQRPSADGERTGALDDLHSQTRPDISVNDESRIPSQHPTPSASRSDPGYEGAGDDERQLPVAQLQSEANEGEGEASSSPVAYDTADAEGSDEHARWPPGPPEGLMNEPSVDFDAMSTYEGDGKVCGLGLVFAPISASGGRPGVIVKRLKRGGPAAASGKIEPGDRILSIDGQKGLECLDNAKLAGAVMGPEGSVAALQIAKAVTGDVEEVFLTRSRSNQGVAFADREVRTYDLASGVLSAESSRESIYCDALAEATPAPGGGVGVPRREIPRTKKVGLGLTYCKPDPEALALGLVVKRVREGSPCDGVVRPGDTVVAVDGTGLDGLGEAELTRLSIGTAGAEVMLTLRRAGATELEEVTVVREVPVDVPDGNTTTNQSPAPAGKAAKGANGQDPAGRTAVADERSFCSVAAEAMVGNDTNDNAGRDGGREQGSTLAGLGLTLLPRNEVGRPIKRVKDGGPAYFEGTLAPGDVVVAIDGEEVRDISDQDLARLMMGREGSVATIRVRRAGAADGAGGVDEVRLLRCRTSVAPPARFAAAGASPHAPVAAEMSAGSVGSCESSYSIGTLASEASISSIGSMSSLADIHCAAPSAGAAAGAGVGGGGGSGGGKGGGRRAGIGLTFRLGAGGGAAAPVVKRVKADGPAACVSGPAGVEAGDVVVAIDGVPLAGLDERGLADAMMGEDGTVAVLDVRKGGAGGAARVLEIRRGRGVASV